MNKKKKIRSGYKPKKRIPYFRTAKFAEYVESIPNVQPMAEVVRLARRGSGDW